MCRDGDTPRRVPFADIEAILASKFPLDETYIEHWATYWDVLTTWRSLR